MRKLLQASLLAASVLVAADASSAFAQYPNYGYQQPGYNRFNAGGPGLSPYLNMLRGGNPAANYFLGVRPEIDRRNNAYLFSNAIQGLEQRTATNAEAIDDLLPKPGVSGHPTFFMNYGPYYSGGPQSTMPPRGQTQQTKPGRTR
jgi:hypothetical protein